MIVMNSSSCFPVRKSKDGKQNVLQEFRNLDLALNVLLVCFPGLSSNLPRIRHQSDTVYQGENRAEKRERQKQKSPWLCMARGIQRFAVHHTKDNR